MANALFNRVKLTIVIVIVEFLGFFLDENDDRGRNFVFLDSLGS
jgi:hypothetical protein